MRVEERERHAQAARERLAWDTLPPITVKGKAKPIPVFRPLGQAQPAAPAEIPFEFRDGLIWVAVRVPQQSEPLNFLLDSGAAVSVLATVPPASCFGWPKYGERKLTNDGYAEFARGHRRYARSTVS